MTDEQLFELLGYLTLRHDQAVELIDKSDHATRAKDRISDTSRAVLEQIARECDLTVHEIAKIKGK